MNIQDPVLATAAVTSPWWLTYFEQASSVLMIAGGIALLVLRLAISWREWKNRKK